MSKFWSHFVKDLDPYTPGEQPQGEIRLKLNTNENPYPPAPKVIEEIQNHGAERINLYPDPESNILRGVVATYHNVDITNVFVGNGSDEILAFIFYGFFKNKKNLLFPDITYSFYPVYAKLFDIHYQQIPLNNDFEIDLSLYNNHDSAVIFPNPNAPTGIPISGKKIESFGLKTFVANGHNFKSMNLNLKKMAKIKKPTALILKTIKGKGFKIMHNKPNWHYWNKITKNEYKKSIEELDI